MYIRMRVLPQEQDVAPGGMPLISRSSHSWSSCWPVVSWCSLTKAVVQSISVEIAQLDLLFVTYAELLAKVQQLSPDVVELAALATVLHSFYNGTEGISWLLHAG